VSINKESYTLALPYSNTTFRANSIKPYLTSPTKIEGIEVKPTIEPISKEPRGKKPIKEPTINKGLVALLVKRSRGKLCKNFAIIVFLQDNIYKDSRYIEITTLLEKGIFKVIPKFKVLKGIRIFNSRFVNKVKNKGTKNKLKKLRLIVQAYSNNKK
jgi:hypothetical protein